MNTVDMIDLASYCCGPWSRTLKETLGNSAKHMVQNHFME